jgi:DNA-binding response OmpR family regulator
MGTREILVADDELYITTMLSQKLRQAGYSVRTASDGVEALAEASERVPDLVITDFQMPIMSGFELAMKLRETPATSAVPLLMLTARGHRLNGVDLSRTNIRFLLDKPFSLREVLLKVEQLLRPRAVAVAAPAGGHPGTAGPKV